MFFGFIVPLVILCAIKNSSSFNLHNNACKNYKSFFSRIVNPWRYYSPHVFSGTRKNVCKTFEDYKTIQQNPNCWFNPDIGASPDKIARRHGFPFETHKITTKDGYIVTLFRIPHNGSDVDIKRPVIFLQHGLSGDGLIWFFAGSKSLAFTFAKRGYDVWISNSRGSKYSPEHIKYNAYNPEYWNFSFHEMALYDLPVMLDYIGEKTGHSGRILYVGHSMGTTISFIYASLMPQHAQKNLESIVALAPVAYMDDIDFFSRISASFRNLIWNVLTSSGLYGIGPNVQFYIDILHHLCSTYPLMETCAKIIFMTNNVLSLEYVNATNVLQIVTHFPSGFSLKTVLHFSQITAAKHRFQFFDYGPNLNIFFYNNFIPPEYPLSQINVPIHLVYGSKDLLSKEMDNYNLYDKLKTNKTIVRFLEFKHLDFILGIHSEQICRIVFDYIIKT